MPQENLTKDGLKVNIGDEIWSYPDFIQQPLIVKSLPEKNIIETNKGKRWIGVFFKNKINALRAARDQAIQRQDRNLISDLTEKIKSEKNLL